MKTLKIFAEKIFRKIFRECVSEGNVQDFLSIILLCFLFSCEQTFFGFGLSEAFGFSLIFAILRQFSRI